MKILLINKFLYPKGGDAISTINTGNLLQKKGHKVIFWGMKHPQNPRYSTSSYFIDYIDYGQPIGFKGKINTAVKLLYSYEAKNKVEKLIQAERPDIVHLNNFAHQISPSILDVFKKYKIPTVMTMRDYKMVCPSYIMLWQGNVCEKCKGGRYYWCFINKCTKNSYIKSLLNTIEMYFHHSILDIYNKINIFISPSKFLKEKLKNMEFKKEIMYLPNFVNIEEFSASFSNDHESIVYFGRLSQEKGLFTLIDAVKDLDIKLKIIGDGPLEKSLRFKVKSEKLDNINFLGYKSGEELRNEIKNSMAVILPSEWYENNPRTVLESFALGKPVIGSRIGGIPELVKNGETGFLFEPNNTVDLRSKIKGFLEKPDLVSRMGKNAREFVEKELNPEKHYQELMKIYQLAKEANR